MKVKLNQQEHAMFPRVLKYCFDKTMERKETCYVMLDLLSNRKDNRFTWGPKPHAGSVILAEMVYTSGADKIMAWCAWPILCPDVPHGPEHAGGRYTDYGKVICDEVPCEVW